MINLDNIPYEFKIMNSWVGWKDGKVPYNAKNDKPARSNDSSTWTNFNSVVEYYEVVEDVLGIGLVLIKNLIAIDLDNCIVDGVINEFAQNIINKINSYTEISPSGNGIHIFAWGLPRQGKRKVAGIEVYDSNSARYLTITGNRINENGLRNREQEIVTLCDEFFPEKELPVKDYIKNPLKDNSLGFQQAVEYIDHCSGSKAGTKGGAGAYALAIAIKLIHGYGLTEEQAIDLMLKWGTKESNTDYNGDYYPWEENEIIHKVTDASKIAYDGVTGDAITKMANPRGDRQKALEDDKLEVKFRKWSELKDIAMNQHEDWFLKGWSEFGTLTLFTGLPFSGKSTIVSNLISSIANNRLFYSLEIQQCPIMLFDFENKERILVNRIQKELEGDEGLIEDLLYNVSREDCPRPLTMKFVEKCINILSNQIEVIGKKGFLIIDTMRSAFAGGDYQENDPQSMINLLVPLKDLAYKTNWAIIVLHHNAKASDKYSGSTAIAAVPDFLWNWQTDKTTGKGKLSSEGRGDVMPTLNFIYSIGTQRLEFVGEIINDDDDDLILSFIKNVGEVTEKDLKDEFKWGKNKIKDHLKKLISLKKIDRKRDKVRAPFIYFFNDLGGAL